MLSTRGATLLLALVTVAGCSSSHSSTAPTASTLPRASSSSTTPIEPDTAAVTTAPSTTAPPSCVDTQSCALALFSAWTRGDQAAAAHVAAAAAVTKMFSHTYAPIQTSSGPQDPFHFTDCTGAAGSAICTFDGQDQQIQMRVRNSTGGLPIEVEELKWFEGSPLKEVP